LAHAPLRTGIGGANRHDVNKTNQTSNLNRSSRLLRLGFVPLTDCAPLVMARGEGAVVEDVDGNVYLDCCAGIATASTGHSHPDVVRAITDQAGRFLHSSTDYYH